MTVKAIDVASYQSSRYDTDGQDMVVVKATEGTTYRNPKHAAQVGHGREHDLVVGHYHFVRRGSITAQADYFLNTARPAPGDVLALDWEDTAVSDADKDTFLYHLRGLAPRHRVILYCNRDFWVNRDRTAYAGDGLWIADPDAPAGHPRINHSWLFHQHGITGGIDRNLGAFEDRAALRTWANKGAKPPVVTPRYESYPGAAWFAPGRRSPIVAAMHARLVAVGCGHYRTTTNKDLIGAGDIASYQAWQRQCGYTGTAAKWPPGKTTWDKLRVPNV